LAEHGDPKHDADLDAGQIEQIMAEAYGLSQEADADSVLSSIERSSGFRSRVVLARADEEDSPVVPLGFEGGAEVPRGDRRFLAVGEIARSDVAIVFKGRDRDLGRHVALKVLRPEHAFDDEILTRFLEEAQLGGQLQHPGIAPVYGLGVVDDDRPCIAMKLARGETLAALLAARGSPSDERHRFLRIFEQTCHTLAYAHARGVVHGDLTLAHITVGTFGEVQIIAWGHASVVGRGASDVSTDVLALGGILREILAGPHELDVCNADEDLVALARDCLARRPRDAGAVARAITDHLAGAEERARRAQLDAAEERAGTELAHDLERREIQKAAWERRARQRTIIVAAILAATVLLGCLGYLWKDRADRRRTAEVRADVLEVTRQAEGHAGEADWARAAAWARQAKELAETSGVDEVTRRRAADALASADEGAAAARQVREDADMVARLDGIRSRRSGAEPSEIHARYAAAFRDYGIDVETLPAEEAAGKIWKKLGEIARGVDPDEWRDRYRKAMFNRRFDELARITRTADVKSLPAATVATLARYLRRREQFPHVVMLLRRAHAYHAGDFWINYELGVSLLRLGRPEEAAAYLQAALSLRPDHAPARELLEEAEGQ
jgi:serine/threonine-protein kinase